MAANPCYRANAAESPMPRANTAYRFLDPMGFCANLKVPPTRK